jgi:hypothetical protein
MGQPRTRFTHVLDDIRKRGKIWQEVKRESCGKKEEIGECSSIYLYKTYDMLEEEEEMFTTHSREC